MTDYKSFFNHQLETWPDCKKRYTDLAEAVKRSVKAYGNSYCITYNPARIKSATAKVVAGKVDRPCFLCRGNRPAEQEDIPFKPERSNNNYLISVNPFPILPEHFTIINNGHERQEMTAERLRDMESIAKEMKGYLIFFNGACSGASAPDHFHFQAVPQHLVPAVAWDSQKQKRLGMQTCKAEDVKIDFSRSDYSNILCWQTDEGTQWWVVRRRQHRPWQYNAEGEEKVLISPASLECAGIVPLAREEDYIKMNSAMLEDIMDQCIDREPLVDVGISNEKVEAVINDDNTTTLRGVRIGIGFHWDQHRDFRYEGIIINKVEKESGKQWTINRLPVERYLRSVITSEMSATSSLELLKAHAVISRSWLMYGSAPHTLFDVCSDDCCQRYQGISDKMNAVVDQAIEETRGEVLTFNGEICDTRYSKCCGGRTEEFQYCWENIRVPYLTSIEDKDKDGEIFCNTKDKRILRQVLNDYDQKTPDFYEWEVRYTQKELKELVESKSNHNIGIITDLQPVERGCSGRISVLRIVGTEGTMEVSKELKIRRLLSKTHLYSSNFEVSKEDTVEGLVFTLRGKGWGHGVGLCQIGAAVMAEKGYTYRDILEHYYNKTKIEKIW